jgi:hypothetical protein
VRLRVADVVEHDHLPRQDTRAEAPVHQHALHARQPPKMRRCVHLHPAGTGGDNVIICSRTRTNHPPAGAAGLPSCTAEPSAAAAAVERTTAARGRRRRWPPARPPGCCCICSASQLRIPVLREDVGESQSIPGSGRHALSACVSEVALHAPQQLYHASGAGSLLHPRALVKHWIAWLDRYDDAIMASYKRTT